MTDSNIQMLILSYIHFLCEHAEAKAITDAMHVSASAPCLSIGLRPAVSLDLRRAWSLRVYSDAGRGLVLFHSVPQ